MNCQDISRIVDTGGFNLLTTEERRRAEAHAVSCRHCAPLWATHSALARLPIPPMPVDVALRCRTAWAVPPQARSATRWRLTGLGSLVALAAAAGVAVWMAQREVAKPQVVGVIDPPAVINPPTLSVAAEPQPVSAEPLVEEVVAPPGISPDTEEAQDVARDLPLLPRPVNASAQHRIIAFEKALERHPELTEGAIVDGIFMVTMVMREDGHVISSALRHTTEQEYPIAYSEAERRLPQDGMGMISSVRQKTEPLPDGRMLRANFALHLAVVPHAYDMTRSSARVLQIIGDKYADLMLPASSPELNRVVLFLSDAGVIQRELVERTRPGGTPSAATADAASVAGRFAEQLGMDVDEIGMMGNAVIQRGIQKLVMDEGRSRLDDQRSVVMVRFAWQRRPDETGASLGQPRSTAPSTSRVDAADALTVIERVFPDAFSARDASQGTPHIVLTAKGEVIQAGWVRTRIGETINATLKDQLVPGVETSSFSSVTVTNKDGVSANVSLAWEAPPRAEAGAR